MKSQCHVSFGFWFASVGAIQLFTPLALIAERPSEQRQMPTIRASIYTEASAGTSVARFYRDAQGRTRLEDGPMILIIDPVDGTTITLDTRTKIGRRTPARKTGARGGTATGTDVASVSLGQRLHEGYSVTGIEQKFRTRVPDSYGVWHDIDRVIQMWASRELALVVSLTSSDQVYGQVTKRYQNIERGAILDAGLFQAPPDYAIQ